MHATVCILFQFVCQHKAYVSCVTYHFFIHAVMSGKSNISELLDESLKMKTFSHPNILNLIGVCIDAGPAPYIVMPYMEMGSLLQYLKRERPHFTIAEGAELELVSPIPIPFSFS